MKHTILSLIFVVLLILFASTVSATLEITGEQLIIVGEDSSVNDVLTGITIVQFLKGAGYDAPMGSALLDKNAYEEFSSSMMDDYVFYVIDNKEIAILVGADVSSNNEWIAEQAGIFMEDEGFSVETITTPVRNDLLVTYEPNSKEDDGEEEENSDDPVACTMDVRACPDGSFVGRIAPDCAFKECPEYVPEEPEPEPELITCQGCEKDDECIPYGVRLEGQRYCAFDGTITAQKEDGVACSEHYECKSQCDEDTSLCQKVKAPSKNVLVRIFSWFASIFG